MATGGGMSCVKYLLFFFNLLFAITGLIILVVGAKALTKVPYVDLTDEQFYTTAPIVLITVGVVVFVVAFFGCCGAVKENHCMITTFSVLLLVIFVAELAVGVAGYVKHQDLQDTILRRLNDSIAEYPTNPTVRNTFDVIQTDLQCCGINNPGDWAAAGQALPGSCCGAAELVAGAPAACTPGAEGFHDRGCLPLLVDHFRDIALVLGGVGLGVAAVQLLGVIFACCLARSIRSQYETV